MSSKQIDSLVKLRDAHNMVAAAINEYIDTLPPPEVKTEKKWNPDNIKWIEKVGSKGPYQFSDDNENPNFKKLMTDLQDHGGKLSDNGFFYWQFAGAQAVGRKRKQTKIPE